MRRIILALALGSLLLGSSAVVADEGQLSGEDSFQRLFLVVFLLLIQRLSATVPFPLLDALDTIPGWASQQGSATSDALGDMSSSTASRTGLSRPRLPRVRGLRRCRRLDTASSASQVARC